MAKPSRRGVSATLFTSDTDFAKTAFVYLLVSIACALFGAVYELFSHEVYSFYMLYAFLFPLVGGVLPFLAMSLLSRKNQSTKRTWMLYHCGIATLTVGSILCGVLEIYGTTNAMTRWYWILGGGFCFLGIIPAAGATPSDEKTV